MVVQTGTISSKSALRKIGPLYHARYASARLQNRYTGLLYASITQVTHSHLCKPYPASTECLNVFKPYRSSSDPGSSRMYVPEVRKYELANVEFTATKLTELLEHSASSITEASLTIHLSDAEIEDIRSKILVVGA